MDTRIKSPKQIYSGGGWRTPLSGPLFWPQMTTFGHPGQSGASENGPNGFPMSQNLGMDTRIKSLALSKPKLHFGGFRGEICSPLSFFFNFFGVQTRFWPTFDYVLWMAFKNRCLGPFKVVPRSSMRPLMSQTFMTLFSNTPDLFCNLGCQKYFFFQKPRPPF